MKVINIIFAYGLGCALTINSWNARAANSMQNELAPYSALLRQALEANPEILAAKASVEAARATLQGAALPLNNPELEAEAETTDINTLTLGLRQTVDWHDKRGALEAVAQAQLTAAQAQLKQVILEKSVNLLQILGRIAAQSAITDLATQRTEILQRFSRLAKKRHQAGDIPLTELALARLAVSEAHMQQARDEAALIQARHDFFALSGRMPESRQRLPEHLPEPSLADENDERIARQHPEVQTALLLAQAAKREINAADTQRKADPSFGLTAGREDDNNLIALSFSLPLQVRNNFQSNVEAAQATAISAEQAAQNIFWQLRARLRATRASYQVIAQAWQQWMATGRSSLNNRFEVLETLWRSGEMSTTDYLLQVQQTLDTQIAGIELQSDLWQAWIDWLGASNRLHQFFN